MESRPRKGSRFSPLTRRDDPERSKSPLSDDKKGVASIFSAVKDLRLENVREVCLIPTAWWLLFKAYAEKMKKSKRDNTPPPRLDTAALLDDDGNLKSGLRLNVDCMAVTEKVYETFIHWFGGPPPIKRPVVDFPLTNEKMVSMYPISLKLKASNPSVGGDTVIIDATCQVRDLKRLLSAKLAFPPHGCKLAYLTPDGGKFVGNEDLSLQQAGLSDGVVVSLFLLPKGAEISDALLSDLAQFEFPAGPASHNPHRLCTDVTGDFSELTLETDFDLSEDWSGDESTCDKRAPSGGNHIQPPAALPAGPIITRSKAPGRRRQDNSEFESSFSEDKVFFSERGDHEVSDVEFEVDFSERSEVAPANP